MKKIKIRNTILTILCLGVFFGYFVRLMQIQVADALAYQAVAEKTVTRSVSVDAARGEIVDRNGVPLVYNDATYSIYFDAVYFPASKNKEQRRNVVLGLTAIMEKYNQPWFDTLPLSDGKDGNISFSGTDDDIAKLKSYVGVNVYADAQDCFKALAQKFSLQDQSVRNARILAGVYYEMDRRDFSIENPYVFSENIPIDVYTAVKESSMDLPGVDIRSVATRSYKDTTFAPHLIGTIGPIYKEEYATLKQQGYLMNDIVGKSGIEKAAEQYLRGTDGKKTVVQNINGKVVSYDQTVAPIPGATVKLTLDYNLQTVAQRSLEATIKSIAATGKTDQGKDASAGAIVMVNVKTGEVLVAATYPSYDMMTYKYDYQSLAQDTAGKPLFNRATNGAYPPGSTFKPISAIAGLETGAITETTTINCVHTYTRYPDYQPSCLGWHGPVNVKRALAVSCNYFFFEVGYRTGITQLNNFAKAFGLGSSTGIEVGDASGTLAGPEFRTSKGLVWNPGDTLQAAIGQSDNAFTPIQLALYTAAVANGGTLYQARLIKEVDSADGKTVIKADQPIVRGTNLASQHSVDVVKEGMLHVTEDGTGSGVFGNYPIKVGGKTGTAEVGDGKGSPNSVFTAFAPYEDPEIAVAIVIEHGWHGGSAAPVVRDVMDAYFHLGAYAPQQDQTNTQSSSSGTPQQTSTQGN